MFQIFSHIKKNITLHMKSLTNNNSKAIEVATKISFSPVNGILPQVIYFYSFFVNIVECLR